MALATAGSRLRLVWKRWPVLRAHELLFRILLVTVATIFSIPVFSVAVPVPVTLSVSVSVSVPVSMSVPVVPVPISVTVVVCPPSVWRFR